MAAWQLLGGSGLDQNRSSCTMVGPAKLHPCLAFPPRAPGRQQRRSGRPSKRAKSHHAGHPPNAPTSAGTGSPPLAPAPHVPPPRRGMPRSEETRIRRRPIPMASGAREGVCDPPPWPAEASESFSSVITRAPLPPRWWVLEEQRRKTFLPTRRVLYTVRGTSPLQTLWAVGGSSHLRMSLRCHRYRPAGEGGVEEPISPSPAYNNASVERRVPSGLPGLREEQSERVHGVLPAAGPAVIHHPVPLGQNESARD